MKKIILFLSIILTQANILHAFYPFYATTQANAAYAFYPLYAKKIHNQHASTTDFIKMAKIFLRLAETGAGISLGIWALPNAMKPGFTTDVINSLQTFGGIHTDSSFKPHFHGGVSTRNKTVGALFLAAVLLKDGLTNLHKELNS